MRRYSDKLKNRFLANNSVSVWRGLQAITSYRNPVKNHQVPTTWMCFTVDFINWFFTPTLTQTSCNRLHPCIPWSIFEKDMCRLFERQDIRKAPSPDGVSPSCLKACTDQLVSIFTQIFNRSLELCEVPSCFKRSKVVPIRKKKKPSKDSMTTGLSPWHLWLWNSSRYWYWPTWRTV